MLRELRIENLLLIERAELRLGEGLNAITGETGAGKTVLAHSLDLLMGGKARSQIVRPGAEEAWVEGVFDLPAGLLDEPEMAELAERLPEGADEVVLGRRVSAGGRTSAFVAGRAATAADLKAAGRAAARLLRPARAPQADDLLGPDGGARRLRRGRAPGAARALPRGAPRVPAARRRAGRAARARRLAGARSRPLPLRALRDRGGRARPGRARRAGRRARAAAPRRGTARGGGGRPRGRWPAPKRTAAAPRRRWPRPKRGCRRRRASTRRSTRSPSGSPRWTVELGDVAAELRDYADGLEADPGRLAQRSRSGWRRSTGSSASTAAASSRCSPTPSAAARRSPGWRAPRSAGRRPRRRWPRPRRAARKLGEKLSTRPRQGGRAPLEDAGRRGARAAGDGRRPARGRARAAPATASAPPAARRSSSASPRTRASSRRRCATPPRAASSRG